MTAEAPAASPARRSLWSVDDIDLDGARELADPLADAAVAEYFATIDAESPGVLFGALVRHVQLPPEERVPAIERFLAVGKNPPPGVDHDAVARGQRFFNRLVTHHFSALYFSSLPSSYAAAKGVQVLHLTGRLRTDAERRLNETAQFLMDVAAPGALDGGVGVDRVLHVRLMHAAVRWLIANDPAVRRVDDLAPPPTLPRDLVWSRSWGLPGNQEDLVGTWLTFTVAVYDAFDASGVVYTDADVDDHLHMWRLIGHHLGVDPALMPPDRASATALYRRIQLRQRARCASGVAMTDALVVQAHRHMPRLVRPMLPTAFRHYLGDDVADVIGIAPANWSRHLFPALTRMTRLTTRGSSEHQVHARWSAFVGRHLMNGILAEQRHGERPAFQIPIHLADDVDRP
ncbi:MAG: oxygenase MpaB family protein [Actinomycetota bacterium]